MWGGRPGCLLVERIAGVPANATSIHGLHSWFGVINFFLASALEPMIDSEPGGGEERRYFGWKELAFMYVLSHTYISETKKPSRAKRRFFFEKGGLPLAGPERLARTGS